MADVVGKAQIDVAVNAEGVDTGINQAKRSIADLGDAAKKSGKEASEGLDQVGDGAGKQAPKVDAATRNIVSSVERATIALRSGAKGNADYYESIAGKRGANLDVLRPYIAQLREAEIAASEAAAAQRKMADGAAFLSSLDAKVTGASKSAADLAELKAAQLGVAQAAAPLIAQMRAADAAVSKTGISAAQTAAALRGVPAQFTDIVTSLQGGQAPLTVFLQQGGQLKDMFGGAGNAARALGGYVLGLVNPFTIAAAAVAGLGIAYFTGYEETQRINRALITTGNAAAGNAGQLQQLAAEVGAVSGEYGLARDAVEALAATGTFTGDTLKLALRGVVAGVELTGSSVKDMVSTFQDLGKDPVQTLLKLDETYNFLNASTLKQIESLKEQGDAQGAARVAYEAFANTLEQRRGGVEESLGFIERSWKRIKDEIRQAKDNLMGFGRASTDQEALVVARRTLDQKTQLFAGGATPTRMAQAEIDQARAAVDAIQARIDATARETAAQQQANAARKEARDQQQAYSKYVDDSSRMDKGERRAKKIEEEGKAFKAAIQGLDADSKEYRDAVLRNNQALANIEEQFKDKGARAPKAPRAFVDDAATKMLEQLRGQEAALLAQREAGSERLTDSERKQAEFTKLIADLKEKKILTADQRSLLASADLIRGQIAQNVALEQGIRAQAEADKIEEGRKKRLEEMVQRFDAINISIASANQSRKEQYERELDGFGQGDRATEIARSERTIRRDFERRQAEAARVASERQMLGSDQYAAEVEEIRSQLGQALQANSQYYDDLRRLQADGANGASKATANYLDGAANVAKQTENLYANAFQSMEDALVKFTTTGTLDFKSFANSIIADLARMEAKKLVSSLFKDSEGGSRIGALIKNVAGFFGGSPVPSAKGNVFDAPGLSAYSSTIVSKPTLFPFARGAGLMGEAGPEAIIPLRRGSDGRLGVSAPGGGGQPMVLNYAPVTNIDSRTDQSQVAAIVQQSHQVNNKALIEYFQRTGTVPA